jgi:hypothetical protein
LNRQAEPLRELQHRLRLSLLLIQNEHVPWLLLGSRVPRSGTE